MRRAPIVVVSTMAGLGGVLALHTVVAPKSIGLTLLGKSTTSAGLGPPSTTRGDRPAPTTAAPTTAAPTTRTATGTPVNYNYGVLSVAATVSGTKLIDVTIASIDDGGSVRSQSIDQQAVPILELEALQAQSANIQGVSGASYTSAGFEQSLQSALAQLGFP
ncbi:MAG: FMN-binding protein [Acidimicrobiales bacterium]